MYKPSFGRKKQMRFADEHEFYRLLGYLAKSDGSTSLTWEHNEERGAWASEGRVHILTDDFPRRGLGELSFTAGTGSNIVCRINCNEFVQNLREDHGFVDGKVQDAEAIRETVPEAYRADFDLGLKM